MGASSLTFFKGGVVHLDSRACWVIRAGQSEVSFFREIYIKNPTLQKLKDGASKLHPQKPGHDVIAISASLWSVPPHKNDAALIVLRFCLGVRNKKVVSLLLEIYKPGVVGAGGLQDVPIRM